MFKESVAGGAIPKNYFPAVEKGIAEGTTAGPLAGYPVYGICAELFDGSYHPVDSSEAAFKTAALMAFKEGMMAAGPVLLEPIAILLVTADNRYVGDVMGELNKRHAHVTKMDQSENNTERIQADIPMASLFGFGTALRSVTGGNGRYSFSFKEYIRCSKERMDAEIQNRKEGGD